MLVECQEHPDVVGSLISNGPSTYVLEEEIKYTLEPNQKKKEIFFSTGSGFRGMLMLVIKIILI